VSDSSVENATSIGNNLNHQPLSITALSLNQFSINENSAFQPIDPIVELNNRQLNLNNILMDVNNNPSTSQANQHTTAVKAPGKVAEKVDLVNKNAKIAYCLDKWYKELKGHVLVNERMVLVSSYQCSCFNNDYHTFLLSIVIVVVVFLMILIYSPNLKSLDCKFCKSSKRSF
jgi:hypothetical protein